MAVKTKKEKKEIVSHLTKNALDWFAQIENDELKTRKDGSVIIHQNKTYSQAEVDELLDRQTAMVTAQVLTNQGKTYSHAEVEFLTNNAWHSGYWNHYEEINGKGSSHENPLSSINFIKQNVNK